MQQMQRPAPEWKKFFYASVAVSLVSLAVAVTCLVSRRSETMLQGASSVAGQGSSTGANSGTNQGNNKGANQGSNWAPVQIAGQRVSALQRIQREGVIRAGYAGFPPYAIINPNEPDPDKRMSGFAVDLLKEIANRSVPPLKIVWRPMNWETVKADLNSGKFDVVIEPLFATVPRAIDLGFVEPYSYFGIGLGIVRKDDNRFHKFEDLDRPDITIALSEGWTTGEYARAWLHKPKFKSIPVGGDAYIQVDDVLLGRSDVALNDSPTIVQYAKAHPDKVKVLFLDKPPGMVPGGFSVRGEEPELLQFFNTCMRIFKVDGTISRLDKKWKTYGYFAEQKLTPGQGLMDYSKGH